VPELSNFKTGLESRAMVANGLRKRQPPKDRGLRIEDRDIARKPILDLQSSILDLQ